MSLLASREAPPLTVLGLRHRFARESEHVLDIEKLTLRAGAAAVVTGASGSGKTTLAHLLTGITAIQSGRICWGGVALERAGEAARDRWRRATVGLIFQDFHLIPGLSPGGNVMVPAYLRRWRTQAQDRTRAEQLLAACGLDLGRATWRAGASRLSRGEQQRVAIARALFAEPSILVADEPTASLDAVTGAQIVALLLGVVRERGATLLAISHDPAMLAGVGEVHRLERGRLARIG